MTQASEPQNSNTSENAGVARAAAGLKLYDTASHTVSRFTPIKPGQVGIYVCGATVQSSPHIGHIRAAVAFDVVRRWMLRLGYQVTFVRNVTDIDDKILDKAAAAGQQWWARAYFYEREFTQAYDTLGVLPPTYEPRATGHMIDMIDLIRRIIDNGHGYVVYDADGKPTGNVYFDVASWARPWMRPATTSTIRSTPPTHPPTSTIRAISRCGRRRSPPTRRTRAGRRRSAWAAPAGTSNARP